ncbi:MAG: hypothetical protein NC912_00085 [Candidatus Omnitrophica bacterium]|nr:hypothetical protein [Candidatus Omnitrophota bacterium]
MKNKFLINYFLGILLVFLLSDLVLAKKKEKALPRLADLTVRLDEVIINKRVKSPSTQKEYKLITVSFTVANQGEMTTPDLWQNTCWEMFYTQDEQSSPEVKWNLFAMGGCKPLQPHTRDNTFKLENVRLPIEARRILLKVNSQKLIEENDDSNNQDEKEIGG